MNNQEIKQSILAANIPGALKAMLLVKTERMSEEEKEVLMETVTGDV